MLTTLRRPPTHPPTHAQEHPNEDVYRKAGSLLEEFFDAAEERAEDAALAPAAGAAGYAFGAPAPQGGFNFAGGFQL